MKKILNDEANYGVLSNDVANKMMSTNHIDSKIDFSDNRVKAYANVIDTCDEVQSGLRSFLTGHNRMNRTHEHWEHMPDQHQTKDRCNIIKLTNAMKLTVIAKHSVFQMMLLLDGTEHQKKLQNFLFYQCYFVTKSRQMDLAWQ